MFRMQNIAVQKNRYITFHLSNERSIDRPDNFAPLPGTKSLSTLSTFLPNNVTFAGDGKNRAAVREVPCQTANVEA